MHRHLGDVHVGPGRAHGQELATDGEVQAPSSRRRHPGEQGLAVQVVAEAVAPGRVLGLDEYPRRDRFGQQVGQRRRTRREQPVEEFLVHLGAGHRGHRQHLHARLGDPGEPPLQGVPDGVGDRRSGGVGGTPRHDQAGQLAHEERVPAGPPPHLLGQLGRRRGRSADRGHQDADVVRRETSEGDLVPPGDRGAQRRPRFRLAVGPDHQQRDRPDPTTEELQQLQRRLVGPLQVVEHDHERFGGRQPDQGLGHAVEEP